MINFYEKYKDDFEMLVVRADREGRVDILEEIFLAKKRLNILEKTPKEKWNWLHSCNLLSAAPVDVVQFYIDHGVDVNAQDMYGMTPLHYAMRAKNADAAIALLNAGADPNIPNKKGLIPLSMIGYIPDRLDVLEIMLKKGANVNYLVNKSETILKSYKPKNNEDKLFPIYELMSKYK